MPNSNKNRVALMLGANQGSKIQTLKLARIMIALEAGKIKKASILYKTSPWGELDQEVFINQAIIIETELPPLLLLKILQKIEIKLGKTKITHWGPRVIDIDIILYESLIVKTKTLSIPHPFMTDRRFVLIPLSAIAGEWIHPLNGKRVSSLLEHCKDKGHVVPIEMI